MNQRNAFEDTVQLAIFMGMPMKYGSSLGLEHLIEMRTVINENEFSESKLGRWLGWAQAALVAADVGVTLEDVKRINLRWAEDE